MRRTEEAGIGILSGRHDRMWGWLRDRARSLLANPRAWPAHEARPVTGVWHEPVRGRPELLAPVAFRFDNRTCEIQRAEDWHHPSLSHAWLTRLHAFGDLVARQAAGRLGWHQVVLNRWVAENPPGEGVGWESEPLSSRMVHWVQWFLDGAPPDPALLASLALQARYLDARLAWRAPGRLLLMNAKALLHAGLFFQGPEADGWLTRGLTILEREIPRRILADGGEAACAPLPHLLLARDLCDLLNLAWSYPEAPIPARVTAYWRESLGRLLVWMRMVCHPDGGVPVFGEAMPEGVAELRELAAYARRLRAMPALPPMPEGVVPLTASGYARLSRGQAVLLVRLPPAGGCEGAGRFLGREKLAFEWSLMNQRVVVSPGDGVSCSSVSLDGRSCPGPGGWRWRRVGPLGLRMAEEGESLVLACGHDGCGRLGFGGPVHWRQWRFGERELCIEDRVAGAFREALARYHFHPALRCQAEADGRAGVLTLPDGRRVTWEVAVGDGGVIAHPHHARRGASVPAQCLEVGFQGAEARVIFRW
ncbi:MAG: heparinase II/III family protein [Magnetococcales bacterium]|nr:heparinase II/III family protein [Magnetococcales bacterium]